MKTDGIRQWRGAHPGPTEQTRLLTGALEIFGSLLLIRLDGQIGFTTRVIFYCQGSRYRPKDPADDQQDGERAEPIAPERADNGFEMVSRSGKPNNRNCSKRYC